MSKQPTISSKLNPIQFTDSLTENRLIEWMLANKRTILFGFLALFALIIVSYRLLSSRNVKSEADFFQATTDFNLFQESVMQPTDSAGDRLEELNRLEAVMDRHPELHAKYDGLLAQSLLIENEPEKAQSFAQLAFQRTRSDGLKVYQDYAQTSLLMGSKNYEEALVRTQKLKEKMDEDKIGSFGQTLYALNLIRLAVLSQQLEKWVEEKQAWQEIQRLTTSEEGRSVIQGLFQDNHSMFGQYMEERKKTNAL